MSVGNIDRKYGPIPLVRSPRLIRHKGLLPRIRQGRGFSIGEIEAIGLTAREARLLGIYVDERRKSIHEENIETLKAYLTMVIEKGMISEPKIPKVEKVKPKKRRVFRGLTPSGRKARGLVSIRLKETHKYKWKRKARERLLRKRHEASRGARPPFF